MEKQLEEWRKEIDKLDQELIELLEKRFELSKKIGEFKHTNKLPIIDEKRYQELLDNVTSYGKTHRIDTEFIKIIFSIIHDQSIKLQKKKEL